MTDTEDQKNRLFFDIETTGLDTTRDRILEIGAVEVDPSGKVVREFHSLVNPERFIPDDSVEIHGITNDMVKSAPTWAQVAPKFMDFIKGSCAYAHNGDSFDVPIIDRQLSEIGDPRNVRGAVGSLHDTQKIAASLNEGRVGLNAFAERYGVSLEEREDKGHGALLDSQILAKAYMGMLGVHGPGVEKVVDYKSPKESKLPKPIENAKLVPVQVSAEDMERHRRLLETMEEANGSPPVGSSAGIPSSQPAATSPRAITQPSF